MSTSSPRRKGTAASSPEKAAKTTGNTAKAAGAAAKTKNGAADSKTSGKKLAPQVQPVEPYSPSAPQDFYYDYIGPSGAAAHVSERLPRAVLRYVQRIAARARRTVADIAAHHHLHVADLYVLMVLQRSPDFSATATDLKSALSYTSGGMTKRIDRLEQQRLVERRWHPTDRRAWMIGLTEEGIALVKKIDAEGRKSGIRPKISAVFDEKEWELFAAFLQRLDSVLEAEELAAGNGDPGD